MELRKGSDVLSTWATSLAYASSMLTSEYAFCHAVSVCDVKCLIQMPQMPGGEVCGVPSCTGS